MVLLRVMFFISLFFATDALRAAEPELDALLTSISGSTEATPQAPAAAVEPVMPKAVEPQDAESIKTPTETVETDVPKMPEPIAAAVEPKEVRSVVEPKEEPIAPKVIVPIVHPVMPKVAVSPVLPKVVSVVAEPEVVVAPGAPKVVSAPTPVIATAVNSQPGSVQAQMQITDVHEIVPDGLDTLHIDSGGNWLEKRNWYKKAEQLFEVIRTTIQKAADIRMKFVHEVNQVGQQIDEFYETVGFQKGQIEELLQALSTELTTEEKIRSGDLSSDERSVRLKIQEQQQLFQSMSADFKLIEDLDDQVDKTMMKAFKEIDACRALETRAWNNFKDIGMELDDKKARVLYYEMENFQKNIEQKLTYLQTNLLQYLQAQLVVKVDQTTAQIKTAAQTLQNKGLAMQTLLEKDSKGDFVILQKRDDAQAQDAAAKAAAMKSDVDKESQEASAKSKKSSGATWYQKIADVLVLYGGIAWSKLSEWFMIAACCVQTILCKIQEMICKLLGH